MARDRDDPAASAAALPTGAAPTKALAAPRIAMRAASSRLTLDRPDSFNALSTGMLDALQAELDHVASDASARVVVIGAAGKAFLGRPH